MPRMRRRKLLFLIPLVVLIYFLVFIEDYISNLRSDAEGMDPMSFKPPGSRRQSNIHHALDSQIRKFKQHEISDPPLSVKSIDRWKEHEDRPPRNISELDNSLVPNLVFFLWCDNKTFEYNHFLSVMSVWSHMEPDAMEIYYKSVPLQDKYNDWLDMLKSSIPNLALKSLPKWVNCDPCGEYITDLLHDRGGVYMAEDTVILQSLHSVRQNYLTAYFGNTEKPSIILSSRHNPELRQVSCLSKSAIMKRARTHGNININKCGLMTSHMNTNTSSYDCVVLSNKVLPRDILTAQNRLATSLRYIAYGETSPLVPSTGGANIPKIVHYIWYNKANMTFVMYLSVLSSLYVIKADRIFIHGGDSLQGHYWEKVKVNPRVHTIHRDPPRDVYGNQVLYTHHKSDVIRGDILYKYGGIYIDWDVLWVKPVDDLISIGYDVIVNFDHMPRWPFPDSINMGVVLARPRAKYIKMWRKTYEKYRSDDFFYNPIEVPYKIYERFPTSVKIEPRLQVMCYQLKCHPVFHPQFKNFEVSQPFDWRNDVYSIHFTFPDPEEYKNETTLKNGHGMFAEIGQFIVKSANLR